MSVALKPPIMPESISLDLRRSDRMVRSAEGGTFQREVREGQARWIADITWPPLHGADRRELDAWLAMMDRGDRWALIEWPFKGQGSLSGQSNLVENGDFTENIDGWFAESGSAEAHHNARRLKALATGDTPQSVRYQDISLTGGGRYIGRLTAIEGHDCNEFRFVIRDLPAASDIFFPGVETIDTVGHFAYRFVANQSVDHRIRLFIKDEGVANRHFFADTIGVFRIVSVNGSGQQGNSLEVRDVSSSSFDDGVALAGEFVEIFTEFDSSGSVNRSELKRLVTDVDRKPGTSTALLQFEPALRHSPPDAAMVVFHRPRFKAVMTNENRQTRYTQPDYVQVTRRFEEDILA